jgi:hypothetical protein
MRHHFMMCCAHICTYQDDKDRPGPGNKLKSTSFCGYSSAVPQHFVLQALVAAWTDLMADLNTMSLLRLHV